MKSTLHRKSIKKLIVIASSVIVVLSGSIASYALLSNKSATDAVDKYGSDTVTPTEDVPKSDTTQGSSSSPSISSPKSDPQNPVKEPVYPGSNGGDIKPSTPIGTFVSNHSPNIDGSPHPNTINSTCTSSPYVLCYISFTKGSEIHTLPGQKADASGNTSWNWKISDIGLTEGQWSITAIAQSDTQQTTSVDPTPLTVGP